MTTPCTCKAEHWQPHADSCPQAKQRAPKIGVNSEDIVDLLRKVPRATALPPDEEGWRLMIGGICHKAADELTQLRGNLSLAEEGLANYALEVERLRSDFKNFHRLLCERFGYGHDEDDWLRDQLSLIEWIAKRHAHEPLACDCPEGAETTDPSKHEEYCDYRQANAEKSGELCNRLILTQRCQNPKGHDGMCEWVAANEKRT